MHSSWTIIEKTNSHAVNQFSLQITLSVSLIILATLQCDPDEENPVINFSQVCHEILLHIVFPTLFDLWYICTYKVHNEHYPQLRH